MNFCLVHYFSQVNLMCVKRHVVKVWFKVLEVIQILGLIYQYVL